MSYYNEFEINSCLTNLKYALNLKAPIDLEFLITKISDLEILHNQDSIKMILKSLKTMISILLS